MSQWSNLYTAAQVQAILASKRLPTALPRRRCKLEYDTVNDHVTIEHTTIKSTYGKPLYLYITQW